MDTEKPANVEGQSVAARSMTNRQVEDVAIAFVLAREAEAGRTAVDRRGDSGFAADISATDADGVERIIEVKAYGGSARGTELWLEPSQYDSAKQDPQFHLYLVENVRAEDPLGIRLLDVRGADLERLMGRAKQRTYYTVPFPVRSFDELTGQSMGRAVIRRVMEGVALLHSEGYHRARFLSHDSPSGMHSRVLVGRDLQEATLEHEDHEALYRGSITGGARTGNEIGGETVTTSTSAREIADSILRWTPGLEATHSDPAYVHWFSDLLTRCRALDGIPRSYSETMSIVDGSITSWAENAWSIDYTVSVPPEPAVLEERRLP